MMTVKYKNKYLSCIQKQLYKFAVVLVVVSMLFDTLGINQTFAYFSDTAISTGNTFTTGTLAISLDNTNTFSSGLLYPTDSTSTGMDISNTGSLHSQYEASTTLIGSDNSACDYITMTATNGTYTYTGLIKDFTSSATTTTNATWNYNFTVSPTAPPSVWGKTCYFNWSYTAWQSNLSDVSSGFTSIKEKSGSIRIGKAVVLNEILYNPKSTDPAPANKEFIELYNNSNVSFDLAGWQVSEISGVTEQKYTITTTSGSNTAVPYSGSTIIPAKGWMTLILSDSTALNNTGDTVRLYDASSNKLDEYAYAGGKPAGFSEARIPDGVGAWVDPLPTPGGPNEIMENAPEVPVVPDQVSSDGGSGAVPDISVATTTNSDVTATTTEPLVAVPDSTASTTENMVNDITATTTASTTVQMPPDEPIVKPVPVPEPAPVIESVVSEPAEPVIESAPIVEPEPVIEPTSIVETPATEPPPAI